MPQSSREVLTEHPEFAEVMEEFPRNEREECAFLESETAPAVWIIRRKR